MNTGNRFVVLFSIAVVLVLLAACGAPEPTATMAPTSEPPVIPTDTPPAPADTGEGITVTFEGGECVYHGPERVPAGEISIVLDVRDQTAHESYGVQTLTLDEGYTLDELVPYQQEISFPLWAHDHGFIEAAQGTSQARTIVLFDGPLFLSCFTNTADETQPEYAGILDPIEIEPAAVPRAQNAATAVAESGETSWDMVVLGDSLVAGDYSVLPEAYAARIEEDLGVEVEIQNLAVGGETTQSLLTNVQKYPWYREPLQEAEVILISVGGGDLPCMEKRFFGGDDCGGTDNQDCLRQQLEESQAEWDAVLDEIVSLADPGETLIRPIIPGILEYYARVYKDQPTDVAAYNSYVVSLYEYMARSCAERGIPVLDLYALYDGPNADPSLPEIADRGDGVHVSSEGDAVIAELLSEMGYEPLIIGPAAVPGAKNAATAIAESGDTTWTYVALGDSVTWGMIPLYAEMLEEDLGVTVIVHNRTAGGDHSSQLLERLRTSSWLRKELREADVITIEIPWNAFEDPCLAFLNGSPGACGGSDNQDCLREALGTYKADTDAIIAEIVSLRSPSEALIRLQDTYQFNVGQSKAEGAFETISKYWREANAHVIEVAEYYHIPVARVYDAFMGEDGSEDPQDRGLIHDGFHTSPKGAALMAELFRDLGYEFVTP